MFSNIAVFMKFPKIIFEMPLIVAISKELNDIVKLLVSHPSCDVNRIAIQILKN